MQYPVSTCLHRWSPLSQFLITILYPTNGCPKSIRNYYKYNIYSYFTNANWENTKVKYWWKNPILSVCTESFHIVHIYYTVNEKYFVPNSINLFNKYWSIHCYSVIKIFPVTSAMTLNISYTFIILYSQCVQEFLYYYGSIKKISIST